MNTNVSKLLFGDRQKGRAPVLLAVTPPRTGERTLLGVENLLQSIAVPESFSLELAGDADGVTLLARCIDRDMVLVTHNARDFRALLRTADIHPGLVILPSVDRRRSEELLRAAIAYLSSQRADPMDTMVDHVLEVSTDATMRLAPLAAR